MSESKVGGVAGGLSAELNESKSIRARAFYRYVLRDALMHGD